MARALASIARAAQHGGARYGDSATVGAGLPLLRTMRELQAGGDRIHRVAGVLSGSLAWLFNHYDGLRPFSASCARRAQAGYTEPDPREDLSGEDVRRKLLILARAAALRCDAEQVEVASLVPDCARGAGTGGCVDAACRCWTRRCASVTQRPTSNGERLRFVGGFDHDGSVSVGLESLPRDHPLAGGAGTDNRVAIWSRPLSRTAAGDPGAGRRGGGHRGGVAGRRAGDRAALNAVRSHQRTR